MPPSWRWSFALLADLIWLAFNVLMAWFGFLFVRSEIEVYSETAILQIPDAVVHAIIPIGFALMAVRLTQHMVRVYVRGGPEVLYDTEKVEEEL